MDQQAAPYVLAAGQARSHPGTSPVIKAGAADTGGLFTFAEEVMGPRTPGGPLHVHHREDEFLYVIDGHLLVQVGEERHDLGPGCFAWMPRQVPHAFANVSDSPVRFAGAVAPGGIESSGPRSPPTSPSCRDHQTRSGSRPSGPATPAPLSGRRSRSAPQLPRPVPDLLHARPATRSLTGFPLPFRPVLPVAIPLSEPAGH